MPDQPAELGAGALRQLLGRGLLVFRLDQPHLDELVGQKGLIDCAEHGLAEPTSAHLYDRAQSVSLATQPFALGAAESGRRMGVGMGHGERGRLACAPVVLRCLFVLRGQRSRRGLGLPFRVAMAACLLFAAACASPPPAEPSMALVPPTVSLPPPSQAPEAAPPPAALDPEPVVPEPVDPLFATVEAVLLERAPALSEAERAATAAEIVAGEREHGLPALLLLAVIDHESRFDPTAKSRRGALGLMQIRPFVGADVAYRHHLPFHRTPDLFKPQLNVAIGIRFLAELNEEFGDLELALAAYHIGPTRVRARVKRGWRPRGPYVRTVMSRYNALRRDTGELATAIGG